MKVMFIVYHDIRTEARSQEILESAKKLGETVLVSYSTPINDSDCKCIQTGKGKRNYFSFIKDSIMAIKNEEPNIIILHDNYTALILRWIHKNRKHIYVIYDSSELYIDKVKYKSIKEIVASHMKYFEKKYLRYANIVIAANIERASIMKNYFKLKESPLVFDNVHIIEDEYDVIECNKKYKDIFADNAFYIVYAGGIGKGRLTFDLAESVGSLGLNYRLLIVGQTTESEKKQFYSMINEEKYKNIFYFGFVPRNEWRYLLSKAHVSVSAFAQDTVNNTYCASGKLYESLFEGKPILTSENPPLKRICDEHGVGVSTSNFTNGILELKNNYDYYSQNVQTYIKTVDMKGRIESFVNSIKHKIKMDLSIKDSKS